MNAEAFCNVLGVDFYTGVPDSQLKGLLNYLDNRPDKTIKHIVAANEGNACALAAGYHLSTGKIPIVYMQNSGLGNMINPYCSLLDAKVYGIPCIFVIGWRGEPDVQDEPQHIFQGEITLQTLKLLGIEAFIIEPDTSENNLNTAMEKLRIELKKGNSVALVVRKGALTYNKPMIYENEYCIRREDAINEIIKASKEDIIVSTTGKASRELYEIREHNKQSHKYDFLTVGSMGHASSIACTMALENTDRKVWCLDGDGALLMHMGALVVIGECNPRNLVHVLLNNCAHETVGGMQTPMRNVDICKVADACGYEIIYSVDSMTKLRECLEKIKSDEKLTFLEIKVSIGSREDLGRPTITPYENKKIFMENLKE